MSRYLFLSKKPVGEWVLLTEFQSNFAEGYPFNPSITASSGEYKWDLGDGTQVEAVAVNHIYTTTVTRTVKLYGRGRCEITGMTAAGLSIIGGVNLSNDAFKPLTSMVFYYNPALTSFTFPSAPTGTVSTMYLQNCNIQGELDLSMYSVFSETVIINMHINPNLTGIKFAPVVTGRVTSISAYSCNLTGVLDLSMFGSFSATSGMAVGLSFYSNKLLTGVVFAPSISGFVKWLRFDSCDISGNFDLSMFRTFTDSASIYTQYNPRITGLTFAPVITGAMNALAFGSCNITGSLDLSMFDRYTTNATIHFNSNKLLSNVVFPPAITGNIYSLAGYGCSITGNLNLTMFDKWISSSASVNFLDNPTLTGVTMPSVLTGTFREVVFAKCNIQGVLDLSMIENFSSSGDIRLYENANMTGVVFAPLVTGSIYTLSLKFCKITGVLDLTMFKSYHAQAQILLNDNNYLTGITFSPTVIGGNAGVLIISRIPNLEYVSLVTLRNNVNYALWEMESESWNTETVNRVLCDIDSVSTAGYTERIIRIGGTNGSPDSVSGGYDGLAARASLQSKGFFVMTN